MHAQNRGHRRRLALRSRRQPHAAMLNVEKCQSGLALREDFLLIPVLLDLAAQAGA